MSVNFQKCPNGHYYDSSLGSCPYCPSSHSSSSCDLPTDDYANDFDEKTQAYAGCFGQVHNDPYGGKTTIDDGPGNDRTEAVGQNNNFKNTGRTIFFDETENDLNGKKEVMKRDFRKLVGWLVSYTIDKRGIDFKLYEGRNTIGRDSECQIIVPDGAVTGRHAVLLFRNGKYSITDQQSSNGTYVNGDDIELDPCYLKDGDIIRIGQTIFKFRSSL